MPKEMAGVNRLERSSEDRCCDTEKERPNMQEKRKKPLPETMTEGRVGQPGPHPKEWLERSDGRVEPLGRMITSLRVRRERSSTPRLSDSGSQRRMRNDTRGTPE